jgi:hypothetical protein
LFNHCLCYFLFLFSVACKEGHQWWPFGLLPKGAIAGLFSSGAIVFRPSMDYTLSIKNRKMLSYFFRQQDQRLVPIAGFQE